MELINEIANETFMPLTVGGVQSIKDVSNLLEAGADKVSINTSSFENEKLIKECSKTFGSQCIVGSIDYKMVNQDIIVYSNSGTINKKLIFMIM